MNKQVKPVIKHFNIVYGFGCGNAGFSIDEVKSLYVIAMSGGEPKPRIRPVYVKELAQ